MAFDVEKACKENTKRIEANVRNQNTVNQRIHDEVRKLDARLKVLEGRETDNVRDQNRVNQRTHDELGKMDKRIKKLE